MEFSVFVKVQVFALYLAKISKKKILMQATWTVVNRTINAISIIYLKSFEFVEREPKLLRECVLRYAGGEGYYSPGILFEEGEKKKKITLVLFPIM